MSNFNLQGGVGILGFISPMDTQDTYYVIDPLYGIDGLRNVETLIDLNSITDERRRPGMIVGVSGGTVYYKLKSLPSWSGTITDWDQINFSNTSFVDKETPSGDVDGVNVTFLLSSIPIPGSEHLYLNGLLQDEGIGEDYTIIDNIITYNEPPLTNMKLRCSYRTA
jgi:hypothetical protein